MNNNLITSTDTSINISNTKPSYYKPRQITINTRRWLVFDQPLKNDEKTVAWIRAIRPLESVNETLYNLIVISLVALPVFLLIAIAGGLFISGRALAPIDRITRTARDIGQGDLTKRLNLPRVNDEVGRLALTFDEMLDKLESTFKRERQFTSDASHELRTPIAVISAHAEESLTGEKSTKEYKHSLEIILNESIKMKKMISQLLMLARSEDQNYKLEFENLYLDVIVYDVVQELQKIAEEAEVKLQLETNEIIKIKADQMLMTRAVINLIDNAIKFNRPGGWVNIGLYNKQNFARLVIEDNGIGIAENDLPNIFTRFYRADKARTAKGAGIGLSLVKWIIDAHQGIIKITSTVNIGTKIVIDLPLIRS